jgi:hypothetical protein
MCSRCAAGQGQRLAQGSPELADVVELAHCLHVRLHAFRQRAVLAVEFARFRHLVVEALGREAQHEPEYPRASATPLRGCVARLPQMATSSFPSTLLTCPSWSPGPGAAPARTRAASRDRSGTTRGQVLSEQSNSGCFAT